jgi:hypothetical protein
LSDVKNAKEQAQEEVENEKFEEDKVKYKDLFKQLAAAEKVVANIKREIEDTDAKISERE